MLSELNDRSREILRCVVESYVETGDPIGSRTISKRLNMDLSPASIRNVMADLEESGFLAQPHTSAGRVPTDKGYRYYVDGLLPTGKLRAGERSLIDKSLAGTHGEFSEVMELIPRLLSNLTSQVGYFLTPPHGDAVLKHIEFVRLHDRKILVIFVDRSEVVSHRVLETESDYEQESLNRAGRYLVTEFGGLSLSEIRRRLVELMAEEKARFDRMLRDAWTCP